MPRAPRLARTLIIEVVELASLFKSTETSTNSVAPVASMPPPCVDVICLKNPNGVLNWLLTPCCISRGHIGGRYAKARRGLFTGFKNARVSHMTASDVLSIKKSQNQQNKS